MVYILGGLLLVQVFKAPGLEAIRAGLFFCVWAAVAGSILRIDAKQRQVVTISGLTLLSAMCYGAGAALGQPSYVEASRFASHLFWADVALIAAIGAGVWRELVGICAGTLERISLVARASLGGRCGGIAGVRSASRLGVGGGKE